MVMLEPSKRARSPGRPREFDLDEAVVDAMEVFWTRGFEATSVPDLLAGTGLSRGSLYKAFGDKKSLFLRVLDRYCEEGLMALRETLERPGTARDAIRYAFMRYASLSSGERGRRGCLAVATAVELVPHDPEVTARIKSNLRRIQDYLATAIHKGQLKGEIPADRDAQDLSRFLLCQLQGMRVIGKAGMPRREMESTIEMTLRCLI